MNIKAQCFRKNCDGAKAKKVWAVTWLALHGYGSLNGPVFCPYCGLRMRITKKINQRLKGSAFSKVIRRSPSFSPKLGQRKTQGRKKSPSRKRMSKK
jgi:hypothetical protein